MNAKVIFFNISIFLNLSLEVLQNICISVHFAHFSTESEICKKKCDFCIGRFIPSRPRITAHEYKVIFCKISRFQNYRSKCCKTYEFEYMSDTFHWIWKSCDFFIGRFISTRPRITTHDCKSHSFQDFEISGIFRSKCCETYAYQYTSHIIRLNLKFLKHCDFFVGRFISTRPRITTHE